MAEISVYWKCNDYGSNTYGIFDRVSNMQRPGLTLSSGQVSDRYALTADDNGEGSVLVTKPGGTQVGVSFIKDGSTESLP